MPLESLPQIRFPKFSDTWSVNRLVDLSKGGFSNGVFNDIEKKGSGYKLINVKDMYVGNSISVADLTLLNIDEKEFKKNKVLKGDVFFTRSSIVAEGIAYSNIYLDDYEDVTYDGHLMKMTPDSSKVLPQFIFYALKTFSSRKQFIRRGKISTMTTIGQDDIAPVKLSIPTLEEQQKIADFLTSVDKKISLLKEKYALLNQYKKGVMQKLFKQEIRFKDENGKAFPDWQEKTMNQVLSPEVREIPKPSKKYLALGIRSHMKGTFQKPDSDPDAIAMEKLFVVRPNDLVVNITFAWEGAIAIAKTEDDGGLVSHRFPTYTFKKNEATHRYFKHIIQLKRFKYMLDLISPGGAGRNRVLSKSEFLKLKWELPSVKEQEKIADFLDTLDTKLQAINEQIELTQTFKKGLLQQMFV